VKKVKEKPTVSASNTHFLKGYASWLYCDSCGKTVAYLCYVSYSYFHFSFTCACGASGWTENKFGEISLQKLSPGKLPCRAANGRYCCPKDSAALFSPVPKNLKQYSAAAICRTCETLYEISESF